MDLKSVGRTVGQLALVVPWERLVVRDNTQKDLDKLQERLKKVSQASPPPRKPQATPKAEPSPSPATPNLPTNQETTTELKNRLAKELYKLELDLSNRLKIAGHPCDCGQKHKLGVDAALEELIPKDPHNPLYGEIRSWYDRNLPLMSAEASASGKHDDKYPEMAGEVSRFRKRLTGTEAPKEMPEGLKKIMEEKFE